jgi:hypothetical protein
MLVVSASTAAAAATEIEYWAALKATFCAGLRLTTSATTLAASRPTRATAGPPASISASAKQVEVVTSPSEPRVWTFSGISSPARAHSENSASSAEKRLSSVSAPVRITSAAQAVPAATTAVTYRSSGLGRRIVGLPERGECEGALPRQPRHHPGGGDRGHPRAHHLRPFLAFMGFCPP